MRRRRRRGSRGHVTILLPPILSGWTFVLAACVRLGSRRPSVRSLVPWRALLGSQAVFNLHIWYVLLLYPSLCRVALGAFLCTPYVADGGVQEWLLYQDPSVVCYTREWASWAAFAAICGVGAYCIGIPLAALFLTSQAASRPARRRQRCGGRVIEIGGCTHTHRS